MEYMEIPNIKYLCQSSNRKQISFKKNFRFRSFYWEINSK